VDRCVPQLFAFTLVNRFTAKSLVAAGLAKRILVQLSYAIGVAAPLSIFVDSYGTGTKTDAEMVDIIAQNFDLRPGVIGALASPREASLLTCVV
jgi:S-adenosylmethionine synthetase